MFKNTSATRKKRILLLILILILSFVSVPTYAALSAFTGEIVSVETLEINNNERDGSDEDKEDKEDKELGETKETEPEAIDKAGISGSIYEYGVCLSTITAMKRLLLRDRCLAINS